MSKLVDEVVDSETGVDNLKRAIAERIKKARHILDVTQKELCTEIGMPLPSLRNYEAGKQIPGGEALTMLMRAGIAPAWVLTGTGDMFCKPAEATGVGIAEAIRQSGLSIDETVTQLGIGIDELMAYLEGRVFPENGLLERVSEVTGYSLEKLLAARDIGEAVARIDVVHAKMMSGLNAVSEKAEMTADEATLLARYGQADDKGKALLMKISAAIANPSLKAWFDAGLAMSEAATIFEKKR